MSAVLILQLCKSNIKGYKYLVFCLESMRMDQQNVTLKDDKFENQLKLIEISVIDKRILAISDTN